MESTDGWNTFVHTGKVSDYLNYATGNRSDGDSYHDGMAGWEERGQRERTSDGNGAFGCYHW